MSIAFLAFGVILFDVLGDAMFGSSSNLLAALGVNSGGPQAKEAILPGLGLLGDNLNNLAEVVLNMITIYLYRLVNMVTLGSTWGEILRKNQCSDKDWLISQELLQDMFSFEVVCFIQMLSEQRHS